MPRSQPKFSSSKDSKDCSASLKSSAQGLDFEGLEPKEWLIIALFSLVFLTLASVPYLLDSKVNIEELATQVAEHDRVKISVLGEVQRAGVYEMEKGACLAEVLDKAKLTLHSDIAKLKISKKLQKNEKIVVPRKKYISFYLKDEFGAKINLIVPAGFTRKDVFQMLSKKYVSIKNKINLSQKVKEAEVLEVKSS